MKPLLTQAKDNAGLLSVLAGIALVAGSFSQLEKIGWLIGVPAAAYQGKETAEKVEDQFDRYLEKQETYTQALQDYTKQIQNQQMQQQMPMQQQRYPNQPAPSIQNFIEYDEQGTCWQCQNVYDYYDCWSNNLWHRCDSSVEGM